MKIERKKKFQARRRKNGMTSVQVLMAKIIKFLGDRYLAGGNKPLKIAPILDHVNLGGLSNEQKFRFQTRVLCKHERISVDYVNNCMMFAYKPAYENLRDAKDLMRLLKKHDSEGLGGILMSDIHDCLPNAATILKHLRKKYTVVTRSDKKKVIFYEPNEQKVEVSKQICDMWRSVSIDGLCDERIEEYLAKKGEFPLESFSGYKAIFVPRSKKLITVANVFKDNAHVVHMLKLYPSEFWNFDS